MSAKPLWLRAVYRLERAVGEPVEAAVRTETYFDLMTTATRTTKAVKRSVGKDRASAPDQPTKSASPRRKRSA